jgi:8-oxo-dGTP pyrophosphatase MutT (NUDIX family)
MYKIFFKDKTAFLTDSIDATLSCDFGGIHKLGSIGELKQFLQNFATNNSRKEAYIYHHDKHELLRRFRQCFKNIPAAGGLVWNKNHDSFLTMIRRGRPDLPKGKVEAGESFEQAAIREVTEECGIHDLQILKPLVSTFHVYHLNNQPIFKETKWFEMKYNDVNIAVPQSEEYITQIKGLPVSESEPFIQATYPSMKEVLLKAGLAEP